MKYFILAGLTGLLFLVSCEKDSQFEEALATSQVESNLESRSDASGSSPTLIEGRLSFSTWDQVLQTLENLDTLEREFSNTLDALFDEGVEGDFIDFENQYRSDNGGPIEQFIKDKGHASLYTKAFWSWQMDSTYLSSMDQFAVDLFNSSSMLAIVNENYEIAVAGQTHNLLSEAVGSSVPLVEVPDAPTSDWPWECWGWSFETEVFTFTASNRQFESKVSYYRVGAGTIVTGRYTNSSMRRGRWRNERDNDIRITVSGNHLFPADCEDPVNRVYRGFDSRGWRVSVRRWFIHSGIAEGNKQNETWTSLCVNNQMNLSATQVW